MYATAHILELSRLFSSKIWTKEQMLPFENIDQKRRKSDFMKQAEPCCLNMHRAECPPYFPTVGGSQLKNHF